MSFKVAMTWDGSFLDHDGGEGHPESADRLRRIWEVLEERGLWDRLSRFPVREAERHELARAHTPALINRVLEARGKPLTEFDPDTHASAGTTQAALRASGVGIDLAKAVWEREFERGFALIRPPGHHAERDRIMGFCYFNNIAVAAHALLEEKGAKRLLIVDWDVHHGNGTQEIFDEDPRVLFVSLHQYPFYPGTGRLSDIGRGAGRGTTVNLALPQGMGDHEYRHCFQKVIRPLAEQFRPEMVLLSAGYDAHRHDPLGMMRLTTDGFAGLATDLCQIADEVCGGRLVAFLEGGYNLDALASSVAATFGIFLGEALPLSGDATLADNRLAAILDQLRPILAPFWTF